MRATWLTLPHVARTRVISNEVFSACDPLHVVVGALPCVCSMRALLAAALQHLHMWVLAGSHAAPAPQPAAGFVPTSGWSCCHAQRCGAAKRRPSCQQHVCLVSGWATRAAASAGRAALCRRQARRVRLLGNYCMAAGWSRDDGTSRTHHAVLTAGGKQSHKQLRWVHICMWTRVLSRRPTCEVTCASRQLMAAWLRVHVHRRHQPAKNENHLHKEGGRAIIRPCPFLRSCCPAPAALSWAGRHPCQPPCCPHRSRRCCCPTRRLAAARPARLPATQHPRPAPHHLTCIRCRRSAAAAFPPDPTSASAAAGSAATSAASSRAPSPTLRSDLCLTSARASLASLASRAAVADGRPSVPPAQV